MTDPKFHPHGQKRDDSTQPSPEKFDAQNARTAGLEAEVATLKNTVTLLQTQIETINTLLAQVAMVTKPTGSDMVWGSANGIAGWETTSSC